jgi:hypothetical protein
VIVETTDAGRVLLGCATCGVRVSVPATPRTAAPAIRAFFGVHHRCRTSIDLHDARRDVYELLPGPIQRRAV